MKLHLLGTGTSQGVPVIGCSCEVCMSTDAKDKRLRSSAVFEVEGKILLIDTGPDMRQQLLRSGITRIDAILYTHEHNDHVIGLDDVRPFNFMQQNDMQLYGLPRVISEIRNRFSYVFAEQKYPGAPSAKTHLIDGNDSVNVEGVEVLPIKVMHGNLPILGYRVNDVAFITDASFIVESELNKLKDLKVLVVNALRQEKHHSHFSLNECLAVIENVAPERAYITHVSHRMGKYSEWSRLLPGNVFASYDGMVIEV